MNASRSKRFIAAGVAAIGISSPWAAQPAEATTDITGGGHDAAGTSRVVEIDAIVALRKERMAYDYVEDAVSRAQAATHC